MNLFSGKYCAVIFFMSLSLLGCESVGYHKTAVQNDAADRLSVGKVQKEIRVGMSGAQVIEALGSPNIVSTDEQRREVWVYDKIATDKAHSSSSGGVYALIIGFGSESSASSTSQRTLTVIIKFDKNSKVRDFAYHTSSF